MIVVYNPQSGGAISANAIRAAFKKHRLSVDELIAISDLNRINEHIKKNARIAVVGGDGTISAVASKLVGTPVILVPLPGGTLNHFTKDLGIPQEMDKALGGLRTAKIRKIDTGSINDRIFVNNSSIGMYPTTLRMRRRYETYIGKWPAAVLAMLLALVQFRSYRISIGDKDVTTPFVFVGNNEYRLDTFGTAERRKLNAGHLCVFIAKTTSRWKVARIAFWTLAGRPHELDEFEVRSVESLVVHARRPFLQVAYDGEVRRMRTPLRYSSQKKSLHVMC